MKLMTSSIIAACALAIPMLMASPARAGLDACGDISVQGNAECKAEVKGGCTANCTPVHFEAACAAKGYASCKGQCDLPSVNCSGSCEADCQGQCANNPDFSCNVNCQANCDANCDGECKSSDNTTECKEQCKASCKGECEASCNGAPVKCEGSCKASCNGQCKVKTNLDCQVKCQSNLSVDCKANLEGGCKAKCERPEGAVFCDGQFVDDNGNAKACLDALTAWTAKIDAYSKGSASAQCSGGSCEANAEGEAGCSMSVAGSQSDGSAPFAIGLFGALGALLLGQRRRRANRK